MVPLAHVVGHHDQHRAQGCQRDEFRQWRRRQDDHQQRQGVGDSGDRCAGAAADVGCGPRNRSGGGNTSEKRADEVGDTLRHQLLIGIVTVINHPVRDDR